MKNFGWGILTASSVMLAASPLQALPDAQIIEKLQNIPVFTLTDQGGAPLTASVNGDPKKGSYTGVYLSQKEAKTFLQKLQRENPEIAKKLQIRAVPLSEMYKIQIANNSTSKLDIAFVPNDAQVKTALALTQKTNPQVKSFNGVPLFVARAGKQKGYITVNYKDKKIIPLFFEREQVQVIIDQFKKENPALASTTDVQVLTLESLLDTMRTKNDALYSQVAINPSREAIEYLKTQVGSGTTKPATKPATSGGKKPVAKPK
jgi:Tic22-like family